MTWQWFYLTTHLVNVFVTNRHISVYKYIYIYIYMYMYIYIYIYMCVCVCICVHHICLSMYIYVCVCMYIYIYIYYAYLYVYIYKRTFAYVHTWFMEVICFDSSMRACMYVVLQSCVCKHSKGQILHLCWNWYARE
jgi:hypothetical protein